MSDTKIVNTVRHEELLEVDGITVGIEESIWDNGKKSFDVWEIDVVAGDYDGSTPLWENLLTEDGSFDDFPDDDQIRTVLPEKGTFYVAVRISACTLLQAQRVIIERAGPDDDYGFTYELSWDQVVPEIPAT